jgi:hypothetical protein
MKTRKSLQVATVAFAVTMLAGYITFSQRQARARVSKVVAPSSKLRAPLIDLPGGDKGRLTNAPPVPTLARTNAPQPPLSRKMVLPGSKSAAVFDNNEVQSLLTFTNGQYWLPAGK